ncbi:MAG: hypothetical protein HFH31_00590 [Bacilli bacterium]|nr:hypothetical protein [Bacilli bacterium]
MKNEIEELNLLYGITIFHILNQYEEFKLLPLEKQKEIAIQINSWLVWLEDQENVSSFNIILIGTQLLENYDIRKQFLSDDIDKLHSLSGTLVKTFDIMTITDSVGNKENFGIEYPENSNSIEKRPIIEKLDNYLYSCNLIYKDLIFLLIYNYNFGKKLNDIGRTNFTLHFLNVLNFMYYHLDNLLKTNRQDLYYCSLYCIESMSYTLFPKRISTSYDIIETSEETKSIVCRCIYNALCKINQLYHIEIPCFNYNNSKKTYTYYNSDIEMNLYQFIFSKLNISQRIFIFKIADMEKNYIFTDQDISKINDLMNELSKSENIKIYSQKIDSAKKNLIIKTIAFSKKYCENNNLKIENLIYRHDFDDAASITFLEFQIVYKNYNYRFSLKKINNNFFWKVDLKNNNSYRIKLFLYDDFKHLIQAMIND